MKKIIKFLMLTALIIFGITADYNTHPIDTRTVEEKMVESLIIVDNSSGIVIHSEEDRAVILTSYHVIASNCELGVCSYDTIEVWVLRTFELGETFLEIPELFTVTNVDVNIEHDLALVEISTDRKFESAPLGLEKPNLKYGADIFVVSNPNRLFRSLKKGIISSPLRMVHGSPTFEFDGGVIFGSSGGGIFKSSGELIGVIKSVRLLISPYCYDLWDDDGNHIGNECVRVPLPFIGFAVRPDIIKEFIKHSVFCEDFDYGCVVEDNEVKIEDGQEKIDE